MKTSLEQPHQLAYRQSRRGVRTLFLNGSTTQLGYRVAQRLHQHPQVRLIQRASTIPLEFTHGDMLVSTAAAQQLVAWLRAEQVDTLIHLDVIGEDTPAPNREAALQHNVMGTLTLLGGVCRRRCTPRDCAEQHARLWRTRQSGRLHHDRHPPCRKPASRGCCATTANLTP